MLLARLRERSPSAVPVGPAVLYGYVLRFHKIGRDGSGKCDAHRTGRDSDLLHGVIFEIDPREQANLDQAEGVGNGYERKSVLVAGNDTAGRAVTYYATRISAVLKPFHWYKALVVAGAKEHRLPASHVAMLESIESARDDDQCRHMRHARLLNPTCQHF